MAGRTLLQRSLVWAEAAGFPIKPATFSMSEDGKCLTVLDYDQDKQEDSDGPLFGAALGCAVLEWRRVCILGPSHVAWAFSDMTVDYCFHGFDPLASARAKCIKQQCVTGNLALLQHQFLFTGAEGKRVFWSYTYSPDGQNEDGSLYYPELRLPDDLVLIIPNLELFPHALLKRVEESGHLRIISSSGSWMPPVNPRRSKKKKSN